MGRCSGMSCCFCSAPLDEATYIAVDSDGEILALCPDCYEKAGYFFGKEGRCNVKPGHGDEGSQQEIQSECSE